MKQVTVMKVSGSKPKKLSDFPAMDPVANIISSLPMMNQSEEDGEEEYEQEDGKPCVKLKVYNLEDKSKDKLVGFLEKLKVKFKMQVYATIQSEEEKKEVVEEVEEY